MAMNEKMCRGCKKFQSKSLFYKSTAAKDGLFNKCKRCTNSDFYICAKKRRDKAKKEKEKIKSLIHPGKAGSAEYAKSVWLKVNYNITLYDYNRIFEEQKGCCAICNKHQIEIEKGLVVDHNHKTNQVRALLCHSCNVLLGFAKEEISTLIGAISYLNKHNN
mgnify:CR=1 FL=1